MNGFATTHHAKWRSAKNLKPGWWVRSFTDDGTERWSEVIALLFATVVVTGEKLVHIYCTDCNVA